ncbi:MAG TPA: MopE-related protein [Kofleriaceae bacterium]|jgi:hypothetical protein|nr:MopE-related protein [Kofleriaceae bacterium]
MRAALVVLALVVVAACGDNIKPSARPDATADSSGMQATCGDGMITGDEQCESGACCVNCKLAAFNVPCRAALNACDVAEVCDGLTNTCPVDVGAPNGTSCGTNMFCQNGTCGNCNVAIDADFDGVNQCLDCNDNNGLVKPQAAEHACEGLDDDCDGKIDEDYDLDQDGYSVCSDDPLVKDCNDAASTVHPGATELCGTAGTGNGIDENCNGYIDETCQPCDNTDNDGDGKSECQGDCDDAQPTVGPGKPEACDGFDTDCNKFTTQNCNVSDKCMWTVDNDVCKDDLQCGCIVDATTNQCTGNYRCASFCEGSYTGPIGAGCTTTQTCQYYWTSSDNLHACAETTATIGTKLGGATCTADSECRSTVCDILAVGGTQKYCIDFCDHDAPDAGGCATGTVCETLQSTTLGNEFEYASCGLSNGTQGQDQSCTGGCKWGTASCVGGTCHAPCGDNSECPSGTHHCSVLGTNVVTGVWGAGSPTDIVGKRSIEVVPVCMPNAGPGMYNRRGGAACVQNSDCTSEFCDNTLKVCVELCSEDTTCPPGLTCEPIYLQTSAAALTPSVTWARACVNPSFGDLATRM